MSDFGAPSGIRNFQELCNFCVSLESFLFPSCQSHKNPTEHSVWRKGFFGILLSDIVLKEMALGFTSDIAKNNLGESFYRTFQPYFAIFPCLLVSFQLSHPLKRPNTCACVQCRISTTVMAMTGRGCLSSLPSSSSSLLAIGLVL